MTYIYQFFLPLAGVVVLIFLLTLLQYGIDDGVAKDAGISGEEENAVDRDETGINKARDRSVENAIHAYHSARDIHERERAKRERVTIVVLIATAIFAFLAAVAAGISAWIFQGQLIEMEAEQRPWVSSSQAEVSAPLVNSRFSGPHLGVGMRIRNSGRSPALRIRVPLHFVSRLAPGAAEPNLLNEQRTFCDRVKKPLPPNTTSSWIPEVTLFPGEDIAIQRQAFADVSTIGHTITNPSIIGCIIYDSTIFDESRQTGIIWDVFRRDQSVPEGIPSMQLQPGDQIDASQLILKLNNTFGMGPAY